MKVWEPALQGSFASISGRHQHVMRIVSWSLEGPLKVLMSCPNCTKTATVKPSRRIRNIPDGFNPTSWAAFLDKGDERMKAVKAQEIQA